ncbi:MAG: adenosine-specific kinase [Candidatus Brocadiales bacterium]
MELKTIRMEIPEGTNIIIGQTHFIKTAEDLYEVMVNSMPGIKFGVAFCEASGPCLVRAEGNDEGLKGVAARNAFTIAAGHTFVIVLKNAFPINVLNAIKHCPEICSIFCATANPVEIIVAETELGRGVIGVVDGYKPKGIEGENDVKTRKEFLRKIGYKLMA